MTTPAVNPGQALAARLSRIQQNLRSADPGVVQTAEQIRAQAEQANLRTYALARSQATQRQARMPQWAARLAQTGA